MLDFDKTVPLHVFSPLQPEIILGEPAVFGSDRETAIGAVIIVGLIDKTTIAANDQAGTRPGYRRQQMIATEGCGDISDIKSW